MTHSNNVPDFLKMAKELKENASRYAATESVNFFKESFVNEGFTDSSFTPWQETNNPLAGNRTLFKKGDLMRSIHKTEANEQRVVVESDLDYSEIQNEGGEIVVTEKMKRFFWAKYYEFSGKTKTKNGKASKSKDSIKNNDKANFCKAIALKKVGEKLKIPQHQYMGESHTLIQQFEQWYTGEVNIVFKQHLNKK